MPSDQKNCQACGIDVGSQKRVKDPRGLYYCQPCYTKLKKPVSQASATPVAAAASDLFACADCKKLVPQKLITNDDGDFVCQPCFAKRRAPVLPGQKAAVPIVEYQRTRPGDDGAEPFSHSLGGGALIALIVLAGTFIVLSILNFFLIGATGKAGVFIGIAIASGIETLLILILACLLIFSMFITAKVMSGIEFGYLGAVLWKSIVAILGIFIASVLLGFLHLPGFLGLGATLVLYAAVFVIIFKIEFAQAIALALVNIVVWFFATVAMFSLQH